ncbi:hypothetical protein ZWY2020_020020 [Hordeum vulgare]|nr:hypothetical protein ZWY2020_020020 [Hordeum vulgare]
MLSAPIRKIGCVDLLVMVAILDAFFEDPSSLKGMLADQDTQFSNKNAEIPKIWNFTPKLDHQVNMSKVQLDKMKP